MGVIICDVEENVGGISYSELGWAIVLLVSLCHGTAKGHQYGPWGPSDSMLNHHVITASDHKALAVGSAVGYLMIII